jgi:hypothetical protein
VEWLVWTAVSVKATLAVPAVGLLVCVRYNRHVTGYHSRQRRRKAASSGANVTPLAAPGVVQPPPLAVKLPASYCLLRPRVGSCEMPSFKA